jgi:squalene-hopene/tetraprenyl-beta-curcumene cyclase
MCLIKHDPAFIGSLSIYRAAEWILGMQNPDGGCAAFDYNNDKMLLNRIPISDMDSLCDPSTADVTGQILECFGLLLSSPRRKVVDEDLLEPLRVSAIRSIAYLELQQDSLGTRIYGISNVLCGLATLRKNSKELQRSISRAIKWLKSVQNEDGGWGGTVRSYADVTLAGIGHTTPSQTA